ncbi:MAG: iron-containing alcohol dehydrogenase, partial [Methanobacterium sp.]|nr:iron-containing alcohol dehydrogenase [Methanobacterium sp.]
MQGEGELKNLGVYLKPFGEKALLVASSEDQARVQTQLDEAMGKESFELISCGFNGECSKVEVARIREIAGKTSYNVIIGLGGGKAIDTAKTLGYYEKKPVVVVPTIASTDAPCSSLAVLYTEEGTFDE